jgi:hypothetical protein
VVESLFIPNVIIMTNKKYIPEPTDPKEVLAALAYADKVLQAQLDLDQMLIKGLQGPFIDREDLDFESLRRKTREFAPKNRGRH